MVIGDIKKLFNRLSCADQKGDTMNSSHIPHKMYSISELQNLELGKKTRPFSLFLNENNCEVKDWTDLIETLIFFLATKGLINQNQIPIYNHAEGQKYFWVAD